MNAVIWHNPRCGTSRKTLALLRERGVEPEVRLYLTDPPTAEELEAVLDLLGLEPPGLVRRKEAVYKQLGLGSDTSREAFVRAMVENPILIERPVVLVDGRAALGRPPESVLAILPGDA